LLWRSRFKTRKLARYLASPYLNEILLFGKTGKNDNKIWQ
jgi:hypothetical protein